MARRVLGAALLPALAAAAPALRYFGFYENDLSATHTFTNLHQTPSFADAVRAHGLGQQNLLSLLDTLFTAAPKRMILREDAEQRLAALAPTANEMLRNGTLLGFNLGDELVWNCLAPANLTLATSLVRKAFPRGSAIIWYNEAAVFQTSPFHDSCGNEVADFGISADLDWFSVDIYHMDGPVAGWPGSQVRPWYETHIYPHLTADQRVMLVPGSFGSDVNHYPNGTYVCDRGCYDAMCRQDAQAFVDWATEDPRVVAIMPWNWGGCPTCNGSRWTPPHTCCMDELGTKDQPLTRAAWAALGAKIIAPRGEGQAIAI